MYAASARAYREKNKEKVAEKQRAYREKNKEALRAKAKDRYHRNKDRNRSYRAARARAWRKANPEMKMITAARSRAKKRGIAFSITASDIFIPELCPVLGIRLQINERYIGPNSPTLDRIRPELGYVPGNVIVVSARANTIKQNATPDEIARVAAFYQQLISPNRSTRGDVPHGLR